MPKGRMQNMGRHKLWRAQVKKIRRKRLRQKTAQERDALLEEECRRQEMSPTYQAWIAEQEIIEKFREEEEERLTIEKHKEWERIEIAAQQEWCLRKLRAEKAKKEREEQEVIEDSKGMGGRTRKDKAPGGGKEERTRRKTEKTGKSHISDPMIESKYNQEELMKEIIDFVEKGGERPAFASDVSETNPNMPVCPFFSKTGACRFGDRCSRNHPRPALSKVVLLPNFYSHFGMDQSMHDEYDTDLMLEYEDSETYQHFRFQFLIVCCEVEAKLCQYQIKK
ncbi:hypothetical protein J437_LFUL000096 [Ladona fulva]|uniref:C3H1-type domain-containing protein n=1 Tax=Ladona fulva TaxID=123851 RepID=A0A8K0P1X4_LADFU|nr:hypothetical protein J437_LFUL000096 [Ladona fulva]